MDAEQTASLSGHTMTRRSALNGAAALAPAMATLELAGKLAFLPRRSADYERAGLPLGLPDIQFDIGRFLWPARNIEGMLTRMPPVHTVFLTARLLRRPDRADQAELARAIDTLESGYPFSADGLITFVAYGLPYFRRLPSSLVTAAIPRLRSNTSRFALEEATPGPADVATQNPGIRKPRLNIPVRIENNDLLITLRGDDQSCLRDAVAWLVGSDRLAGRAVPSPRLDGLLSLTSGRGMFRQEGLPRLVAAHIGLPFQRLVDPLSPRWLVSADEPVDGAEPAAGPAAICTFVGNSAARLTTSRPGDYFDNAGIQQLAHVILDLARFFDTDENGVPRDDAAFVERMRELICASAPEPAFAGELANIGAPPFPRRERTPSALGDASPRLGITETVRGGRSAAPRDTTPRIQIDMDGSGFDSMDVPSGRPMPKLQFTAFVPTADSLTGAGEIGEAAELNSPERFRITTRRQNFLAPPRRHRAFPLVEFI